MTTTSFLGGNPINRIGFGAMQLAGPGVFGPPRDPDGARAVLRRAIELGVDHIDTSQYYGPNVVNDLIRETLYPYPDNLKLVTKVGARRDEQGAWLSALTPAELRAGVEDNLRSLRVERMDLVNLRVANAEGGPDVPTRRADRDAAGPPPGGQARPHRRLQRHPRGRWFAMAAGSGELGEIQNAYSVIDRADEAIVELAREREIAFVPFFPLGSAFTGGPATLAQGSGDRPRGRQAPRPATQVALAWLLAHYERMLLIPGTTSVTHLEENLGAAGVALDEEDMAALEDAAHVGRPV